METDSPRVQAPTQERLAEGVRDNYIGATGGHKKTWLHSACDLRSPSLFPTRMSIRRYYKGSLKYYYTRAGSQLWAEAVPKQHGGGKLT